MPQGKLKKKTVYFLKMTPGPLPKEDFEKRLVRSRHWTCRALPCATLTSRPGCARCLARHADFALTRYPFCLPARCTAI
jgi:hypothetical protein